MKKVIELFEKYVQYIAVALGALFAAWMAWMFLGNQPGVEIGGSHLSAGEVDPKIAETSAAALESRINGGTQPPPIAVPAISEDVVKDIKNNPTTQPLPPEWTDSRPLSIDVPAAGAADVNVSPLTPNAAGPGGIAPGGGQVKELAALPAAKPIGVTSGLSTINPAVLLSAREAAVQVIPVAQPGAAPGAPGAAPAQPPAPAAGAAAGMATATVDRNWVTASFEIPADQLAAAVQNAHIPPQLQTSFMRVEVERQELMSNGQWGNSMIVRPISASPLAAHPLPQQGNQQAELAYKQWADTAQVEILQPGFYPITGGSAWTPPAIPGAAPVQGNVVFNPQNYLKGPIPTTLSPDERKQVMEARVQNAKAEADRKRQERKSRAGSTGGGGGPPNDLGEPGMGGPPPGMGGGGRRGPGGFAPTPPNIISMAAPLAPMTVAAAGALLADSTPDASFVSTDNVTLVQYQPNGRGRPPAYGPRGPMGPMGPMGPNSRYGGMPSPDGDLGTGDMPSDMGGPGAPPAPNMGTVPSGPFDPAAWNGGNIIAFAHDETVQPDKTYRYRMHYALANPIYLQNNLAGSPAIAQQFLWMSAWSDWTSNVVIPPTVNFFVASNIPNSASAVGFEVYAYVNGQRKMKTVNISPGDTIAMADTAGEFSTGYVLVDVRRDARENYALVMAPDGTLSRRAHSIDVANPTYIDLKKQVTPPTTPGMPGNPGNPRMGNAMGYGGAAAP